LQKSGMCDHQLIKKIVNCQARPTRGFGNYRNPYCQKHCCCIFIMLSGERQGPLGLLFHISLLYIIIIKSFYIVTLQLCWL